MTDRVPIGPGTRVRLTFAIKLESGELVDGTGNSPAEFEVGDGNLLPGFERALFGMKAGEEAALAISAEQGFGPSNPDNVQRIRRDQFQPNMNLSEGLMMSFADAQNAELPGVILSVDEKYVEVDFNHPLAGKSLRFEVQIKSVTQVSNEILRVQD